MRLVITCLWYIADGYVVLTLIILGWWESLRVVAVYQLGLPGINDLYGVGQL